MYIHTLQYYRQQQAPHDNNHMKMDTIMDGCKSTIVATVAALCSSTYDGMMTFLNWVPPVPQFWKSRAAMAVVVVGMVTFAQL